MKEDYPTFMEEAKKKGSFQKETALLVDPCFTIISRHNPHVCESLATRFNELLSRIKNRELPKMVRPNLGVSRSFCTPSKVTRVFDARLSTL